MFAVFAVYIEIKTPHVAYEYRTAVELCNTTTTVVVVVGVAGGQTQGMGKTVRSNLTLKHTPTCCVPQLLVYPPPTPPSLLTAAVFHVDRVDARGRSVVSYLIATSPIFHYTLWP